MSSTTNPSGADGDDIRTSGFPSPLKSATNNSADTGAAATHMTSAAAKRVTFVELPSLSMREDINVTGSGKSRKYSPIVQFLQRGLRELAIGVAGRGIPQNR